MTQGFHTAPPWAAKVIHAKVQQEGERGHASFHKAAAQLTRAMRTGVSMDSNGALVAWCPAATTTKSAPRTHPQLLFVLR